jgi:catechol 2,3-dioxygenase-like lactoylglutathione lyase family enzyme
MTNPNSDASVDMKFEIVVIPVSDVDRAKEFYEKLGWHASERAAGKEMGQASNDVTRTLPTNLSPEAVGNAGGSLIAARKVLTTLRWHTLAFVGIRLYVGGGARTRDQRITRPMSLTTTVRAGNCLCRNVFY